MNKPREINPECIDDDAWWDIEALKLAVVKPCDFRWYGTVSNGMIDGSDGLMVLGFLEPGYMNTAFNLARVASFGDSLINACKRVSSQCK